MGKKIPSMKRQVQMAMDKVNQIGQSKRSDKLVNAEQGVYSYKYMNECINTSVGFTQWVKEEFGVKYLYQIKEEHYKAYMQFKESSGISHGQLMNIESHLRKLEKGMNKMLKTPSKFTTDKRLYSSSDRAKPIDRSLTKAEIEQVKMAVSNNARDVIDLQLNLGLRQREACLIRVEHIVKFDDGMKLYIENGKGITKGGRSREVPVPKSFEQQLQKMMEGKLPNQTISNIKPTSLRQALSRSEVITGIKTTGSHAFRHTYCRERFKELMGQNHHQGKVLLESVLKKQGTGSAGFQGALKDYRKNEPLFKEVERIVNQIHSEIGHGKGRWDLAEVYLR